MAYHPPGRLTAHKIQKTAPTAPRAMPAKFACSLGNKEKPGAPAMKASPDSTDSPKAIPKITTWFIRTS